MKCSYCKSDYTDDCQYCPNCGKPAGALDLPVDKVKTVAPAVDEVVVFAKETDSKGLSQSDTPSALNVAENQQLTQANLSRMRKNWPEATELVISVLKENPGDPAAHSL